MATDPYILLGIGESVTDKDVADAYHRALRRFPPEEAPEIFADISEAYESIDSEEKRIRRRFFPEPIPCDRLAAYYRGMADESRCMPHVKSSAWLSDASRLWLRSKVK